MKWRNKNFPVKTVCCKQLQSVTGFASVLQASVSCKCLLAIVTAHVIPQLSELGNKSWLQLVNMYSMKSVLCRLHTHCSHRSQGVLWDELISNSTCSQFCPAKAFDGCFQPSSLGIHPGVLVRSHAYCIA